MAPNRGVCRPLPAPWLHSALSGFSRECGGTSSHLCSPGIGEGDLDDALAGFGGRHSREPFSPLPAAMSPHTSPGRPPTRDALREPAPIPAKRPRRRPPRAAAGQGGGAERGQPTSPKGERPTTSPAGCSARSPAPSSSPAFLPSLWPFFFLDTQHPRGILIMHRPILK